MPAVVDHPWAPNQRDRERLTVRLDRLYDAETSINATTTNLRTLARNATVDTIESAGGVRIRSAFVYLTEAAPGGASDRRTPKREHRPPSTRLMSPRGAALRLMLTTLFEAQVRTQPGDCPDNERPLDRGPQGQLAWIDLLATDARDAAAGNTALTKEDKQRRHLGSALNTLFKADLVALPHHSDARNKHREFLLKREGAGRAGEHALYTVPRRSDDFFVVPVTLFTHGWINVLSDGELAFLLMSAYLSRNGTGEGFQVTGHTRLLHMGVGPETYEAHRLLSAFGLVMIRHQPGRRPNGTVPNIGGGRQKPIPDTVSYLPEGFNISALHTVTWVLEHLVPGDRRTDYR